MTTHSDDRARPGDFRHRTSLQVRFRDTDAFGHVNNAVFASYTELARIRYLIDVLRPDGPFDRMPLILAHLAIDFRSPILFGEEVIVETRVDRVGRTSFAMGHRMTTGDGRLVGEVASVLVAYDYQAARPMPIPEAWRASFAAFEGRPLTDTDTARPPLAAGTTT